MCLPERTRLVAVRVMCSRVPVRTYTYWRCTCHVCSCGCSNIHVLSMYVSCVFMCLHERTHHVAVHLFNIHVPTRSANLENRNTERKTFMCLSERTRLAAVRVMCLPELIRIVAVRVMCLPERTRLVAVRVMCSRVPVRTYTFCPNVHGLTLYVSRVFMWPTERSSPLDVRVMCSHVPVRTYTFYRCTSNVYSCESTRHVVVRAMCIPVPVLTYRSCRCTCHVYSCGWPNVHVLVAVRVMCIHMTDRPYTSCRCTCHVHYCACPNVHIMSLYVPCVFMCLSVRIRIDVVRVMCVHAVARTYTSYRCMCHVYSCAYMNVHIICCCTCHTYSTYTYRRVRQTWRTETQNAKRKYEISNIVIKYNSN